MSTHRYKLADVREFLPGGSLHKFFAGGPLRFTRAVEVATLFDALVASFPGTLPIEEDPAFQGWPSLCLGWLNAVERRGPELWGDVTFLGTGEPPLRVAAHGLAVAFTVGARDPATGAHQGPRLLFAFPASPGQDPLLYPEASPEAPAVDLGDTIPILGPALVFDLEHPDPRERGAWVQTPLGRERPQDPSPCAWKLADAHDFVAAGPMADHCAARGFFAPVGSIPTLAEVEAAFDEMVATFRPVNVVMAPKGLPGEVAFWLVVEWGEPIRLLGVLTRIWRDRCALMGAVEWSTEGPPLTVGAHGLSIAFTKTDRLRILTAYPRSVPPHNRAGCPLDPQSASPAGPTGRAILHGVQGAAGPETLVLSLPDGAELLRLEAVDQGIAGDPDPFLRAYVHGERARGIVQIGEACGAWQKAWRQAPEMQAASPPLIAAIVSWGFEEAKRALAERREAARKATEDSKPEAL